MSIRYAPSLPPSPGQATVPKHELEYIPFSIASKTFVKATMDGAVSILNDDAKVPHLGESAFQDQYPTTNSFPEVYLNMDLSSPQHSTQGAVSLSLEQAFDYPESFGATAVQEQYQPWPHRQSIVQELPSPRASQTRKRKMTGSGLNERYARMTADMSILVQRPRTVVVPITDVFVQPGTMMEHTNTYYGRADFVAEMSSPTQNIPIQAYSQLQSTGPEQYSQVASTAIPSSPVTSDTIRPYALQGTVSQRAMAPSMMGGAYSTPHFRFTPPGGRTVGRANTPRLQPTPISHVDSDVQESNQTVPVNQSMRRTFQPHVHFEDTPQSPRVKAGMRGSAQPFAKRPRKEDKPPSTTSLTSITPPSSLTASTSPIMSTSATATIANDIPSRPYFDFSDTIKSLGQKMKASALAAVTLPGPSNGSSASVVPSGSSRPSQARITLGLDSALMPPPKYIPKRVAQRSVTSEDQFIDEDESMRHDDVGPHLHSERVRNDSADMDIGDDLRVDDQGKRGSGPRSTTDDLDRMVGLEIELCDLID